MENKKIDMAKVLRQHEERFPFPTSIGTIQLKYLTKLDAQATYLEIASTDPEYHELNKQLDELLKIAEDNRAFKPEDPIYTGLDEKQMSEVESIRLRLRKYDSLYAIKVFVEPEIKSINELKALSAALTRDEWSNLLEMIKKLTSREPMEQIQIDMILLAKRYGIPLTDGLTLDKLTVQQSEALEKAEKAEREAIEEKLEEQRRKPL